MSDFDNAVQGFIDYVTGVVERRHIEQGHVLDPPKIYSDGGRKYIRICNGTSAAFFIEKATGNVFKPASFKAPQKNFPRGNIYDDSYKVWVCDLGLCRNAR